MPLVSEHMTSSLLTISADATIGDAAAAMTERGVGAVVVLEGDASEARLTTFLHEKARDWAWAGGQFETPEDGATLSASQPSTFTWHADPADFAEGGAPGDVVMTHLLSFRTARGDLQQVFTTLPEYTPSTPDWQQLVHAHEPITLSLTTGSFVGSELPEEGGPFIGQTLTFTIE